RKYIGSKPMWDFENIFPNACKRLVEVSEGISYDLAGDLHDHMQRIIGETNDALDFLSKGGPETLTRDELVISVQAWPFAFSDEGKEYAKQNNAKYESLHDYVDWIAKNYPWTVRTDPIPPWNARLSSLKTEG